MAFEQKIIDPIQSAGAEGAITAKIQMEHTKKAVEKSVQKLYWI